VLPSHLRSFRDDPAFTFAFYGLGSPRERRYIDLQNLIWYCRHARQPAGEVESLPISEFMARKRVLNELLEREFDTSDL
jgi:hypothetical protein